jgi:uncharacterized protein YlxP (DUF503 family)
VDVLCAEAELHLPEARSLKAKRGIVKGIKQKLHDRFGVSVAEIDYQDLWQRTTLGIALVSSNRKATEALFQRLRDFLDSDPRMLVVRFDEEWR